MKTLAIVTLALALASAAIACSPAQSNVNSGQPAAASTTTTTSAAQLEGLRFATSSVLPNGEKVTSEISFKQGMFDSTACHEMGFAAGHVAVTRDGDALVFRANMTKDNGVVETWSGRIVGDKVSGTVTLNGNVIPFSGTASH